MKNWKLCNGRTFRNENDHSDRSRTFRNITKLIDLLSSAGQVISPAQIQFRYLQQEQISALQKKGYYRGHVTLGNLARKELFWWMENLKICNGRKFRNESDHSDRCLLKRLGGVLHVNFDREKWSKEEKYFHINVL